MKQTEDNSFKFLFWVGVLLHVFAAYFSEGFYQADEHFQVLEFAHLKASSASELPWEYAAQIRSWGLPAFFYALLWPFRTLGVENPFLLAFVARLASGALAFFVSLKLYRFFSRQFSFDAVERGQFYLLSVALFFVPFFHARTSGELWGGALFFLGWVLWQERKFFFAGLVMGLAFEARFQVGFLILGSVLGRCVEIIVPRRDTEKIRIGTIAREGLLVATGLLGAFTLGRIVDFWGYQEVVLSPWKYFERNILHGEASKHGTSSLWSYLIKILLIVPPLGAFLVYASVRGLGRSKNLSLVGAVLAFLAVHFVVSHKELRFLFPLLFVLPALCMLGIRQEYKNVASSLKIQRLKVLSLRILVGVNTVALLFMTLSPAKSEIALYRAVYSEVKRSQLKEFKYSHLGDDPLRYAGLRPHFYMPYKVESLRLRSLKEMSFGYLLLSQANVDSVEMTGILERSTCEVVWSDAMYKFRGIEWIEFILKKTKYRHQFIVNCE